MAAEMVVVVYNISTGEILRTVSCPACQVDLQCENGEEYYLNSPTGATHIIDHTPSVIASPLPPLPTREEMMSLIRANRRLLLLACDWTQLPDAPVDRQTWADYRQELRDFPATCDPDNPVWPVAPL